MSRTLSHTFGHVDARRIPISSIRTDGETQHRTAINPDIVEEYAALMRDGVVFPPVRVWWDGRDYWLADGFHRIAAAKRAAFNEIAAEVCDGSLSEAQWDSYSANTSHGVRWTPAETQQVIQLALQHPTAVHLSNVELAEHLHLSENTVRRWRRTLSSPRGEDRVRIVTRGKATYPLTTGKIGRSPHAQRVKSRETLRVEFGQMKEKGSPRLCRLLNIIDKWVFGSAAPMESVDAMERVLKD